jgi:hypothetical protein
MTQCEFCLEEVKHTASTEFNGHYCEACYRLVISASRTAIKEIKAERAADRNKTRQTLRGEAQA